MLIEKLILLLHGKGLLAVLLALSTGGLVVTGTIDGKKVDLTVKSLESAACVAAVLARAEATLEIEERFADAKDVLRRLRDEARERAEDQDKRIDERALAREHERALGELKAARDEALRRLDAVAGLGPCEDADPDTGVVLDLARLKQEYAAIVHDAKTKLQAALDRAQAAFDRLVETAKPKPKKQHDTTDSGDTDD